LLANQSQYNLIENMAGCCFTNLDLLSFKPEININMTGLLPALMAAGDSSQDNCDQYFIDRQVSLPYTLFSRKQFFINSKTNTNRSTANGSMDI
jgi:hypothetical protein